MIVPPPPSYTRQIQPLLQRRCLPCHDSATRTSGLALDSYAGLMRGGRSGAVVVRGRSGESRLVAMVEGRAGAKMPPSGAPLKPDEITSVKAWIDAGASEDHSPPSKPAPMPSVPSRPVEPVRAAVNAVAFSADGRWLAVGSYRWVWRVDRRDMKPVLLGPGAGPITSFAFSPDGGLLAAAGGAPGQYGEIRLWDVRSQRLVRTLQGHRDAIYSVAFSPDGRTLAAASYDRLVSLWPVTGGPPRMLKDHIDAVYAVAFSPDGREVASAAGDRTIKVWEASTGRRLYTLSEPAAEQYTVAFSRDGRHLAAAGADKMVRVWDVTTTGGKLARSAFAHEGAVLRVLFSRDGRQLYTSGDDRRVKVWDVDSLTEQRVLERQPDWSPALALDPSGQSLAIGRFDGSLALYDAASGRRLQVFSLPMRASGRQARR
jgi:WD40 repeat protein